jgi:uncharacterized protein YukE
MDDLDMELDHRVIAEANDQMKQYAHEMSNNLEALLQELLPVEQGFQGAAGAAFQDFKLTVQRLDDAMATEFDKGADNLAEMHLTITNADKRSASLFPGNQT